VHVNALDRQTAAKLSQPHETCIVLKRACGDETVAKSHSLIASVAEIASSDGFGKRL
jgi:hypothetical protein